MSDEMEFSITYPWGGGEVALESVKKFRSVLRDFDLEIKTTIEDTLSSSGTIKLLPEIVVQEPSSGSIIDRRCFCRKWNDGLVGIELHKHPIAVDKAGYYGDWIAQPYWLKNYSNTGK